jgi:FtsH-binding integral membrane protein
LRGEVRPHPLSWFLFGVLSATGYWVQRDQGAHQGSWTLLAMTIICFLFVAASVARGERSFSRQEWAFTIAGGAVFILYLWTQVHSPPPFNPATLLVLNAAVATMLVTRRRAVTRKRL